MIEEKIYVISCQNPKHKRGKQRGGTGGIFFLLTKRDPEEVLEKLGCPLKCKKVRVGMIKGPLSFDEFFEWIESEEITPAFLDDYDPKEGEFYSELDLARLKGIGGDLSPEEKGVPMKIPVTVRETPNLNPPGKGREPQKPYVDPLDELRENLDEEKDPPREASEGVDPLGELIDPADKEE